MTLSLARFAGLAAATLAAVCGLGAWPTARLVGSDGLVGMGAAAAVLWLAAVAGWVPVSRLGDEIDPQTRVNAVMKGLGIRLGVALTAVVALLASGAVPHRLSFVAWAGLDYGVLLLLETSLALRAAGPSGSSGVPSA